MVSFAVYNPSWACVKNFSKGTFSLTFGITFSTSRHQKGLLGKSFKNSLNILSESTRNEQAPLVSPYPPKTWSMLVCNDAALSKKRYTAVKILNEYFIFSFSSIALLTSAVSQSRTQKEKFSVYFRSMFRLVSG